METEEGNWTDLILAILQILLARKSNGCKVSLATGSVLIQFDEDLMYTTEETRGSLDS